MISLWNSNKEGNHWNRENNESNMYQVLSCFGEKNGGWEFVRPVFYIHTIVLKTLHFYFTKKFLVRWHM